MVQMQLCHKLALWPPMLSFLICELEKMPLFLFISQQWYKKWTYVCESMLENIKHKTIICDILNKFPNKHSTLDITEIFTWSLKVFQYLRVFYENKFSFKKRQRKIQTLGHTLKLIFWIYPWNRLVLKTIAAVSWKWSAKKKIWLIVALLYLVQLLQSMPWKYFSCKWINHIYKFINLEQLEPQWTI
jgi:hypothetical protein